MAGASSAARPAVEPAGVNHAGVGGVTETAPPVAGASAPGVSAGELELRGCQKERYGGAASIAGAAGAAALAAAPAPGAPGAPVAVPADAEPSGDSGAVAAPAAPGAAGCDDVAWDDAEGVASGCEDVGAAGEAESVERAGEAAGFCSLVSSFSSFAAPSDVGRSHHGLKLYSLSRTREGLVGSRRDSWI
jgi:hypothetical protein